MFDVCPAADEVTQAYGCGANRAEYPALWCQGGFFHSGIDLGSTRGGWAIYRSPVRATRPGTVSRVGYPNGLGPNAVFLRLDTGVTLVFGHLDSAAVQVGQRVMEQQLLGLLGTKGNSTAPHLHLEARTDGANQGIANRAAALLDPSAFLRYAGQPDMTPEQNALLIQAAADAAEAKRIANAIYSELDGLILRRQKPGE